MDDPSPTLETNVHESTRLAGACAITLGPNFRRAVIRRARDRYHASAPELGLDFGLILLISKYMQLRDLQYGFFYTVVLSISTWINYQALFGTGFLFSSINVMPLIYGIGSILTCAYIYKEYQERFDLLSLFREDTFDPETVAQRFAIDLKPKLVGGVPIDKQNIIIHRQNNPFIGAGVPIGSWSFSLDISRPAADKGSDIAPFDSAEVYGAIQAAIRCLEIPKLSSRDCVMINGADIHHDKNILPNPMERPQQQVGATQLRKIRGVPGSRRRHYKWIRIADWGGEVVTSFFIRCVTRGDSLFVEVSRYLLTPIGPQYRTVDHMFDSNFLTTSFWFLRKLVLANVGILLSMIEFFRTALEELFVATGLRDLYYQWQIRYSPSFNYGAIRSLRETMARGLNSHFQKSDLEMYERTIDRQIVDTVADFLIERGIDTSRVREQKSIINNSIFNNGLLIQGGKVRAKNIAIGKGARAIAVKTLLARVKPPSAK